MAGPSRLPVGSAAAQRVHVDQGLQPALRGVRAVAFPAIARQQRVAVLAPQVLRDLCHHLWWAAGGSAQAAREASETPVGSTQC